jgi:outer membrane protein OmpA-like peptidoglycan-associated protein
MAIAAAPTTSAAQEKPESQLLIAPQAAPKAAPATSKSATETAPEARGTREALPAPTAAPHEPEASTAPPKRSTLLEESPGPTPLPPALPTPPPQPAAQSLTQGGAQAETAVQDIRLPEPAETPPAPPETFAPALDKEMEAATAPTRLPEALPTPDPAEPAQAVSRSKDADRLTDPSAPPAPPSLDEILVTPQTTASPPGNGDVSEPEVSASEPAAIATGTPGAATRPIISILFAPGSAELSDSGKSALTSLAGRLQDAGRVELLAFAAGDGKSTSKPRRLSLSRAQVVRGYLAEKGIPATRMIIRALGDNAKSGPPDRVDVRALGS